MNASELLEAFDAQDDALSISLTFEEKVRLVVDDAYSTFTHSKVAGLIQRAGLRYPNADLRRIDLLDERGINRVKSTTLGADGCRQVIVESEQPPGCPSCGVMATRRKERRFQRIRDIPVAGKIEVLMRKYRWCCQELQCQPLSFFESTSQVPPRARSTGRLRDHLVDAVIRSGRAMSERAAGFGVSWWMVRAAVNEACLLKLPDVDTLRPRTLSIDEHRFRSVRNFKNTETNTWQRIETKDDDYC